MARTRFLFCLLLLAFLAGLFAQLSLSLEESVVPLALHGVAILFVYVAVFYSPPVKKIQCASCEPAWIKITPVSMAILASLTVLILGAVVMGWLFFRQPDYEFWWSFKGYILTFGLTIILGFFLPSVSKKEFKAQFSGEDQILFALLIFLVIFAGTFRLEQLPPVIQDYEINYGQHVTVLSKSIRNFLLEIFNGDEENMPNLAFIYVMPLVAFLGDSIWTWRFSCSIFGAAQVIIFFFLVRLWFGPRLAFISAFLLSTWTPRIELSRQFGFFGETMFFAVLSIFFWSRAITGYPIRNWIWCGLTLGLGVQNYHPGRLTPIIVATLTAICFLSQPLQRKKYVFGFTSLLFGLLVAMGPFVAYLMGYCSAGRLRVDMAVWGDSDPSRTLRATVGNNWLQLLWLQFRSVFGMFHAVGSTPPYYFAGKGPHFEPVTAGLTLLGFAFSLRALKKNPAVGIFLAWAVFTLVVGGMFMSEAPRTQRLIAASPAFLFIPALGVYWLAECAEIIRKGSFNVIAMSLVAIICCINLWRFFGNYYQYFHTPQTSNILQQAIISQAPEDSIFVMDQIPAFKEVLFPQYVIITPEHLPPPDGCSRMVLFHLSDYKPDWVTRIVTTLDNVRTSFFPSGNLSMWTIVSGSCTSGKNAI